MKIYFTLKTILKQEIVCIGWAIDDETPQIIQRSLRGNEKVLLQKFFSKMNHQLPHTTVIWIGHHIRSSLRFLYQRSVAQKVLPTIKLPSLISSSGLVHDTSKLWAGKSCAVSLNMLCHILKIPRKKETMQCEEKNDFDVWEYIKKKDYATINTTCAENIVCCREVYKRLTFNEKIITPYQGINNTKLI